MEIDTNNVTVLPVKRKEPPGNDAPFFVVKTAACPHFGPFLVDDKAATVECQQCGERLDPMYVLGRLAREETRWHETHKRYHEELARLKERSRTKCQHCGEMTRISRS